MPDHPHGDVAVLVPAAGLGTRLGPGAPKALRTLAGAPILRHAIAGLSAAPSVAVVVVAAPPTEVHRVRDLLTDLPSASARRRGPAVHLVGGAAGAGDRAPAAAAAPGHRSDDAPGAAVPGEIGSGHSVEVLVVPGGATRQLSVAAALAACPAGTPIVAVHDAARALTPPALVEAVAAAVRAGAPAAVPVLPLVDTVRAVAADGRLAGVVDRAALRRVQTPQGFRREVLAAAHARAGAAHTDDAALVEALGLPVTAVPGSELAFKITTPGDLALAEALLARAVGPA